MVSKKRKRDNLTFAYYYVVVVTRFDEILVFVTYL